MTIHVTPIPKLVDLTAPSFTLGTANAAGSAVTAVASDSTLLAFDATLPDAITFGQSGAAGTATVTSRRDHAHATASVDAATQAEQEAASSTTVFVTPGRSQFHPDSMKFWAEYEQTGAHSMIAGYNMTSVTDGSSVGVSDFVIANDMDSTAYGMVAGGNTGAPSMPYENLAQRTDTAFRMITRDVSNDSVDATGLKVIGFGTLA